MNKPVMRIGSDELDLSPDQSRAQVQAFTPPGRRELSGRLAGLTLRQQVLALALWPFLEQLLGFTVGFVDTVLAGHQGKEAANALSVAVYIGWLMNLVQASVGIGATAVISRATGASHRRVANAAVGQALVLALAAGLVMGLAVYVLAPFVAGFTKLNGNDHRMCVQYLRIVSLASPFSALLFVGSACLRGSGDTRSPFLVLLAVNVINAATACTLVLAPAPWGGYGVRGMAWAVVAAWVTGALLILTVLACGWGGVRLYRHRLRPHWHTMQRILRVGLPNLFESLFGMWIANFIVLRIVGMLGNDAAWGAHMIAVRVEAISYLPGFAMGIAAATLAGMYLGLGDPQRARQAIIYCWQIAAGVMLVMGLLFVLAPYPLVRLTTDDPDLLALSPTLLRTAGFVQVFFATAIVLGQGMRGAGDTRTTLLLTACSTYAVRLPLAYAFGVHWKLGLSGVWLALCSELAFRGVLFAGRFYHGGWQKARV